MDMLENRFSMLNTAMDNAYDIDDNPGGIFAKEFVVKKYFRMPQDDFEWNQELLAKEKKQAEAERPKEEEEDY